jgi:putative PIN family toxin of toxin-antitoxin system
MIIVLNTNVLVSGLLSPFGPPARVVDHVVSNTLQVAYDDRIIDEYSEVLPRPEFGYNRRHIQDLIDHIKLNGTQVIADPIISKDVPDPGDLPFAEVAVTTNVRFLVTGNISHYKFLEDSEVLVILPKEFIEVLGRLLE